MVYRIPCSCVRFYISETIRRPETKPKEHEDACKKGMKENSAVAEHAWNNNHTIEWKVTAVLDQARGRKEWLTKEALHIRLKPEEQWFNRDEGLGLPGCWAANPKARDKNCTHKHHEIDVFDLTIKGVVISAHVCSCYPDEG